MDLPASVFLGLMDRDDGTAVLEPEKTDEEKTDGEGSGRKRGRRFEGPREAKTRIRLKTKSRLSRVSRITKRID